MSEQRSATARTSAGARKAPGRASPGGDRSALDRYLAEIRHHPLLTHGQEIELGRGIRAGEDGALERLIEANLKFVVKIAGEYRNLGLPFEDLINEGNLGLIEAARRFDPDRGVRFSSWAVWWIRKAIRNALSDQSHVVRLPVSQLRRMKRVREAEKQLTEELGREPTEAEMSAELPDKLAYVDPIHRHGIRVSSLDEPLPSEAGEELASRLEDNSQISIERQLLDHEQTERVSALYESLPDRQRIVIASRFGLDGQAPQTLSEIGRRMGRSREYVRLIECRAIERLRRLLLESAENVTRFRGRPVVTRPALVRMPIALQRRLLPHAEREACARSA